MQLIKTRQYDSIIDFLKEDNWGKLKIAIRTTKTYKDYYFFKKVLSFVSALETIPLSEGVKISNKLFGIDENKEDNVYRLLSAIEEADSMRKIDYFINITKARLMNVRVQSN